jgi:uncharacterized membrane protein YeaQ/YmgE (transglycosylase-associated protein family)
MAMTIGQLLVWSIIGVIAGTLVAATVTRQKSGYGFSANMLLGMAGAVVGGLVFKLTGLLSGLDAISISARDIVAAILGSVAVLGLVWLKKSRGRGRGLVLVKVGVRESRDCRSQLVVATLHQCWPSLRQR